MGFKNPTSYSLVKVRYPHDMCYRDAPFYYRSYKTIDEMVDKCLIYSYNTEYTDLFKTWIFLVDIPYSHFLSTPSEEVNLGYRYTI